MRYGLELIEKTKADTWITDTTYGFENELADTQWLIEEYMPQVIGSTINKIIFIIQQDSPLMREIEAHLEQLSSFFEVKLVDNYIIRSIL
ncbi:MAG TPA: hypothetical protein ENK86_05385 [Campylobacterales bacterium]|nr:hypothetical protein [Campylobacterales bacterium]